MTYRIFTAAAALAAALAGTASAETIKPLDGGSINLGELAGVAYYTAEPKGYRVVVTLARTDAARAVRFETVLASGQSVTLSTPQERGAAAEAVEISRTGDTVAVSRPRPLRPGKRRPSTEGSRRCRPSLSRPVPAGRVFRRSGDKSGVLHLEWYPSLSFSPGRGWLHGPQ